jgi:hypothetical protein
MIICFFFFFFFFYFFFYALAELVLKRVKDIVRMSFSTQYVICIFYIRNIFAWLSCSPLIFATKNASFFLFLFFPFTISNTI